jgi:hypothetical protein
VCCKVLGWVHFDLVVAVSSDGELVALILVRVVVLFGKVP